MEFKIKKYLYVLNDITNMMLKKDRDLTQENYKKLHTALIIVSIVLVLSIALNIYFILF